MREFRLGLLGHNYVSKDDRSAIVEALKLELPKLFPEDEQRFVSLFTPLAPGADFILTQAVTRWLKAREIQHRVVVVRTVPQEVVLAEYRPQLDRGGKWQLDESLSSAEDRHVLKEISDTIDRFLDGKPTNVVANLLPLALTNYDWHADPERRQKGFRRANAYLALRCHAWLAFYDARRHPPGTTPAAGGTAEALAWARDLAAIPEGYARPWRTANQKSPQIVVVP